MAKPDKHRKGANVSWRWVRGTADGDNPAYLVEQDDGSRALKSHSELTKK